MFTMEKYGIESSDGQPISFSFSDPQHWLHITSPKAGQFLLPFRDLHD